MPRSDGTSSRSGATQPKDARVAAGRRRLDLWIGPEASDALVELCKTWETSATGAIERALLEATKAKPPAP